MQYKSKYFRKKYGAADKETAAPAQSRIEYKSRFFRGGAYQPRKEAALDFAGSRSVMASPLDREEQAKQIVRREAAGFAGSKSMDARFPNGAVTELAFLNTLKRQEERAQRKNFLQSLDPMWSSVTDGAVTHEAQLDLTQRMRKNAQKDLTQARLNFLDALEPAQTEAQWPGQIAQAERQADGVPSPAGQRLRVSQLQQQERQLRQEIYQRKRRERIQAAEAVSQNGDFQTVLTHGLQTGTVPNKPNYQNLAIAMMGIQGGIESPQDFLDLLSRLPNVNDGIVRRTDALNIPALCRMTQQQKQTIAYYVGLGDYDRAAQYLEDISWDLNAAEMEEFNANTRKWAQKHPWLGAGANIASWPLTIPAYLETTKQWVQSLLSGEDRPIDHNAPAYLGAKIGARTSEGVQEAARKTARDAFDSKFAGDAAAFLAGTGLSMGQNLTQMALLGPYSLGAMGLSAAGSSANAKLENGATAREAFAMATAAGAIEVITERIPLERLMRLVRSSGKTSAKQVVKEIVKQMGVEASEETISEIVNNMVDTYVMSGSSEYRRYVAELVERGLSPEAAEKQAFIQFYVKNVGAAALGGAISGGVFGGGALALNQVTKSPYARASENIDQAYGALDEHGMFAPESQKAMEQARRSSDKAQQWENKRAAKDIRSDGMEPGKEFTQTELNLRNQEQTAGNVTESRTGMDQTQQSGEQTGQLEQEPFVQDQTPEQDWTPEEQKAAPELEEAQKETAPEREAEERRELEPEVLEQPDRRQNQDQTEPNQTGRKWTELNWDGLDPDTKRTMDALSRATGVKIVKVRAEETVDGWYQDGTVYVNETTERPILEVVKHEITHRIQEMTPDAYLAYRNYVEQILTEEGVLDQRIQKIQALYASSVGQNLDRNGALDELAADFTAELLLNENAFQEMAQKHRNVAQRMLDWLKNLLSTLKNKFTGSQNNAEVAQLEQAARLWENALRETHERLTLPDARQGQSEARYSVNSDLKNRQFQIIQESNPADDDYHTWIRDASEIKTFQETLEDSDWADYDSFDPDYSMEDAKAAVASGSIMVYSSYPIEAGVFVSPSRMEAESYSGNGQIYSKKVKLTDVAWIDPTQGQFAPVAEASDGRLTLPDARKETGQQSMTETPDGAVMDAVDQKDGKLKLADARKDDRRSGPRYALKEIERLTEDDLEDYLRTGNRYNKGKAAALAKGESIILKDDGEISSYIQRAIDGEVLPTVAFGKVFDRLANEILSVSGGQVDVHGAYLELVASDLSHACKGHIVAKEPGDIALDKKDFLYIPEYLDGYDKVEEVQIHKNGQARVVLSYPFKNGKLIMIEVVSLSRNALQFKTMYAETLQKYTRIFGKNGQKKAVNARGVVTQPAGTQSSSSAAAVQPFGTGSLVVKTKPYGTENGSLTLRDTAYANSIQQENAKVKGKNSLTASSGIDGRLTLPNARQDVSKQADDAGQQQKELNHKNQKYAVRGSRDLQQQVSDLQKQNKRLEEKVNWLKGQMKQGQGVANVSKVAGEVLKQFSSKYNKQTLTARLQTLYDAMDSYGTIQQTMNQQEWRQEARSIAEDVLEETVQLNDELYRQYEDLRKELRNTKFHVPRKLWGELEIKDGYNEFRKKNMGRMKMSSKDGVSIEDVYTDLSYRHPELFNLDAHMDEAEQLLHIAEVLESIQPRYESKLAGNDMAIDYLAGELMERFFDLPQNKTFADRQAQKLDREVAKTARRGERALQQQAARYEKQRNIEREQREKAISRMQKSMQRQAEQNEKRFQKLVESTKKTKEMKSATELRGAIQRHANGLSRRLLQPTNQSHIPEHLRGSVLALLEAINLESKFGYEFAESDGFKFRRVNDTGKNDVILTKRTVAAQRLKQAYENLADGEKNGLIIDPELKDYLQDVADLGDVRVANMSKAQLDTVWRAIRAVERSVTMADKVLGRSKYLQISQMAQELDQETRDRKDKANYVGVLGTIDRMIHLDMLTPGTYFHRLGAVGDEIHRQMREAHDKQTWIQKEGIQAFRKAAKETKVDMPKAEKEVHEFELPDGKLTLTTAQIMSLYALSKRQQAMDHIYEGGLKAEGSKKGLKELGKASPVHVTWDDVASILSKLTPEQKQFMDALQDYMSGPLAQHGNDTCMEVYGYEKFKEKHYWPIKVDENQTMTDPAKKAKAKTLPEYGMARATKPHANNAVMLRSALDVFGEHLNQMETYSAWLPVHENVNRLHNYTFWGDGKKRLGTVKGIFEQVYGRGGNQYLMKLIEDIALGTKVGYESTLSDRWFNKFKAAKVGANLRVAFQQPTAILRATSMINPMYMAASSKRYRKGWNTAVEHCAIAQWKDWGYFEMDNNRSIRELLVGPSNKVDKVRGLAMEAASEGDRIGWGLLWNAVEAETADKHRELQKGSDAFYEQCAKRFGEIIDRTQVVDSVLNRSQIMRSSNPFDRVATSFMSEATKIYNQTYRACIDIDRTLRNGRNAENMKKAGKIAAGTLASVTASFALNAVAQALWSAMRDKDKEKEFGEKFNEYWVENFQQNFMPLDYIPYVKNIWEMVDRLVMPLFKGENPRFGTVNERSDLVLFEDAIRSAATLIQTMNGESKYTKQYAAFDAALKTMDLFGIPAYNFKRDVMAIVNTAVQGMGMSQWAYEMDKNVYDIKNSGNKKFYCDNLYRVMKKDWKAYEAIYDDMVKNGMDPDEIAQAIKRCMAEEAELNSTRMLPEDFAPPGEDPEFDELMQAENGWLEAWGEDGHELAKSVDALEPEEGADEVSNLQRIWEVAESPYDEDVKELALERIFSENDYEKYMAARDVGITTLEYAKLYDAFRKAKFERTEKNGAPSQEDVLNVLNDWPLARDQKRAIWNSYGWKAKSPW